MRRSLELFVVTNPPSAKAAVQAAIGVCSGHSKVVVLFDLIRLSSHDDFAIRCCNGHWRRP
jgi:hypothetical protein